MCNVKIVQVEQEVRGWHELHEGKQFKMRSRSTFFVRLEQFERPNAELAKRALRTAAGR